MLKKINKTLLFSFLFFVNGMIYAADPVDESNGGDIEGNDADTVDINHFIALLIIVSIIYAFYCFKKKKLNIN